MSRNAVATMTITIRTTKRGLFINTIGFSQSSFLACGPEISEAEVLTQQNSSASAVTILFKDRI
jgi:hypothetical protein